MHVEFLLEEESAKATLTALLPPLLHPLGATFGIRVFRGKQTLLKELPKRLRGYREQLHARPDLRVVVLTDRDAEKCSDLKLQLEDIAQAAGLPTKARPTATGAFVVVTRIACEELEAWLLGDQAAICQAYPRVKAHHFKAAFTHTADPDAIRGGTAEALERVFVEASYPAGKLKVEWAERIAPHLDPARNRSASFRCFWIWRRSDLEPSSPTASRMRGRPSTRSRRTRLVACGSSRTSVSCSNDKPKTRVRAGSIAV